MRMKKEFLSIFSTWLNINGNLVWRGSANLWWAITQLKMKPSITFTSGTLGYFFVVLRFFVKAYFQVWSERIHHLWPLLNQEKSVKQKNEGQKSAKEFEQFDYIFGVKIQTVYYCSLPNYHATLVFIYSNLSTLIMIYHHAMTLFVLFSFYYLGLRPQVSITFRSKNTFEYLRKKPLF